MIGSLLWPSLPRPSGHGFEQEQGLFVLTQKSGFVSHQRTHHHPTVEQAVTQGVQGCWDVHNDQRSFFVCSPDPSPFFLRHPNYFLFACPPVYAGGLPVIFTLLPPAKWPRSLGQFPTDRMKPSPIASSTWRGSTGPRAATPRPSRSTSAYGLSQRRSKHDRRIFLSRIEVASGRWMIPDQVIACISFLFLGHFLLRLQGYFMHVTLARGQRGPNPQ